MPHALLDQLFDGIVILLVFLSMVLFVSIRQVPEWLRRARSAHWPTIQGLIESGSVSTTRSRSRYFERGIEAATVNLAYSYRLQGTYYAGYHIETFNDEQKAWSYVDGLKGTIVQVSYNPRNPEVSVLRHPPVPSLRQ